MVKKAGGETDDPLTTGTIWKNSGGANLAGLREGGTDEMHG